MIRENKELKKKNNLEMQVSDAVEKIDEVIKLLEEFKGNIYEVKKIKSCTGTKQKSKIKSSNKTSAIIKNVKGEN